MVQVSLALLVVAAGPPVDLYGDPLPDGAVARLGSVRFRHAGLTDYALRPDGRTVSTLGTGGVRVWDLATGRLDRQVGLDGAGAAALFFRIGPGGRTVLGYGRGPDVAVWDADTGHKLAAVAVGDVPQVTGVAFAPDGGTIAAHGWDCRVVHLVDWRAGRVVRQLPVPDRPGGRLEFLPAVGFSRDGRWLAAGGGGKKALCVFGTADGREVARLTDRVAGFAFAPDYTRLATYAMPDPTRGQGPAVLLIDLATGRQAADVRLPPGGPYQYMAFAPDGRTLACGGDAGGVLVDVAAGRVTHALGGGVGSLTFARGVDRYISREGYRLRLWDPATGREVDPRPGAFALQGQLAVSPDGRLVASTNYYEGRDVSVWDLATGRLARHLPRGPGEGPPQAVGFSAGGRAVRAGPYGDRVRGWDVATGAERPAVQLPAGELPSYGGLAFGPDGRVYSLTHGLVTKPRLTSARWLAVRDAATGAVLTRHPLPSDREQVLPGWWAVGAGAVAYAAGDIFRVVDLDSGRSRDLAGSRAPGPVAFSADGRLVAAPAGRPGGADGVGVWEAATGRAVAVLPTGPVRALALTPGTRAVVVATESGLSVWDVATGRERVRWAPPARPEEGWAVSELAAAPDGRRVVAALWDGSAVVWPVPAAGPLPPAPVSDADLSSADAGRAYRAVWRLAEQPAVEVVPRVRGWVRGAVPDPAVVRRCIADLDAPGFAAREAAVKQLAGMGPVVVPALRQAARETRSAEVRARVEGLLARLPDPTLTPGALLAERGVAVLEWVGTADARKVLAEVAEGPYGAAAKAALERLGTRAGVDPDSGGR